MAAIVLLKLRNSNEVIGDAVHVDDDVVELQDPFIINYRFIAGQPMPSISLSRYIPFSAEHQHVFPSKEVMHVTVPSKAFELYYKKALQYCKEVVDETIDTELQEVTEKTMNSRSNMMDVYQAILERTQFDGPLN
jgi:hypothetical protein